MGSCSVKCDYPLRVQLGPSLVVHAAIEQKRSAYVRFCSRNGKTPVPERMVINTACSWRKEYSKEDLVKNTTSITCKNCAKTIGMLAPKTSPKRFIIVRNDTGDYYKKVGWCNKWVEDPTEATLYKIRAIAEKFTTKNHYLDASGKEIAYHKYTKQKREGKQVAVERIKDPNYDVKTVTITLD